MKKRPITRIWLAATGAALLVSGPAVGVAAADPSMPDASEQLQSDPALVSAAPAVTLSASSVYAESLVTVSGSGYVPGDSFNVYLDFAGPNPPGSLVGYGSVASDGTFSVPVTVPASTAAGSHTLTVKAPLFAEPTTVSFTVLPTPTSASLSASSGVRGSWLVIYGQGYARGENVTALLGSIMLGSARVAEDGTFSMSTTVPFGAPVGPQVVTLAGESTAELTLSLTVTPATVAPSFTSADELAIGVYGTGYMPGETVTATFGPDAVLLNQVTVEKDGRFVLHSPVPAGAALGMHIVTVTGSRTEPNHLEFWNVAVALSTDTAAPGAAYTVNGRGYPPGVTVRGFFDNLVAFGPVTVAADGTFSLATAVPVAAPIGSMNYVLVSALDVRARVLQVPFTVVEATVTATPPVDSSMSRRSSAGAMPLPNSGGTASRGLNIQTAAQHESPDLWAAAFSVTAGLVGAALLGFMPLRNRRRRCS
jgi:hypothetical protein